MMNKAVLLKTPSVLGSWALLLAQVIDSYELDSEKIFLTAGIDLSALKKPNSRIPAEIMTGVWQQAVMQSQDPYIALRMAKHCQPSAFGALGMALAASRHVYEALHRVARYATFISDSAHCIIEEDDCVATIRIIASDPLKSPTTTYSTQASFSGLFNLLKTMMGGALQAKAVHFQHGLKGDQKSGDINPFEDFFGCPVYFSSHCNKIEFNKKDIFAEQLFSNPTLARSLDEWVEQRMADSNEGLFTTRVQKYLLQNIDSSADYDLATVSKEMLLSPRKMQRKLKHEGTSYTDLLNACRQKIAIKLMSNNQTSLSEVAVRLGYINQSNFCRSFKRWTGSSPRSFLKYNQKVEGHPHLVFKRLSESPFGIITQDHETFVDIDVNLITPVDAMLDGKLEVDNLLTMRKFKSMTSEQDNTFDIVMP